MAVFSINSNTTSLAAQRRLSESTDAVGRVYERLSSGMRINRAADDAAGLAVSSSLEAATRVYNQGIRNANDGISLLNIAQSAGTQLTDILTRMKELATSAANGSLSLSQRKSLDKEAYELQKEFNRITQTTTFNGRKLFDGNFGKLNIQAGSGQQSTLSFDLGAGLSRNVGNGSFQNPAGAVTVNGYQAASPIVTGDFNNDGRQDILIANEMYSGSSRTRVFLSNGDGTFQNSFTAFGNTYSAIGDINNDGILDFVTSGVSTNVFLGNGDGTFRSAPAGPSADGAIELVDVNNDGKLDLIGLNGATIGTSLGNGDGTFQSTVFGSQTSLGFGVGDVNGDGNADIISISASAGILDVFLGGGNGRFSQANSYNVGISPYLIKLADLNHDGLADIVSDTGYSLASGSGAFGNFVSSWNLNDFQIVDVNGDGVPDVVGKNLNDSYIDTYFGNEQGSFQSAVKTADASAADFLATADFNGDGSVDFLGGNVISSAILIQYGQAVANTGFQRIDLLTAANARNALSIIDTALGRVSKEVGSIGSSQSRLETASAVLQQTSLNYQAARSRIVDVDVAQESATLTAKKILQQTASAVLSQANQLPALALTLLAPKP